MSRLRLKHGYVLSVFLVHNGLHHQQWIGGPRLISLLGPLMVVWFNPARD